MGRVGQGMANGHSVELPGGSGQAASIRSCSAVRRPMTSSATAMSSRGAGRFDLTLRLYMPEAALIAAPQTALDPPRVERVEGTR